MNQPTPQPDALEPADAELLELYLDGQLSGDRAAQAEARIAQVPAMQSALAQQERIDSSLRQRFQPPAVNDDFLQALRAGGAVPSEPAEETLPQVTPRSRDANHQRRMQLLALAATLACVSVWGSLGWDGVMEVFQPRQGYAQFTVAKVYQRAVRRGFEPDWLCEDDQEFAKTFAERQGQALLLEPLPDGVRMAGLAYLNGLTPQATSMFAYVEDQPVLVVVDRTELITESLLEADKERGLAVFTRRLGGLTLVEVTPFDKPRVLGSLLLAEVPTEPTGHVPGTPH